MEAPSEDEVVDYFRRLSNWNRWGDADELGTLNYITPDLRLQAIGTASAGIVISCSRKVRRAPRPGDGDYLHLMAESGEGWSSESKRSTFAAPTAIDYIGMTFHGSTITHVDGLSHIFWSGKMYNGRPSERVSTNMGALNGSVEEMRDGIVSRGVLLDIAALKNREWLDAGDPIFPIDLENAERRAGVRVGTGDVLVVRTGHSRLLRESEPPAGQAPGLHAACLPWLHEREVAALASDGFNDVYPSGYSTKLPGPIHQIGIVAMGLTLIDNADLEALSEQCTSLGRWEFLFCLAPLRLEGCTGSPANPLAIF